VVAALIALPYGLAMASLMGLPPIMGVYTSIIAAPFCAIFGRNPVLIGGTSSVTVPFIAAAVHSQGISGAAKICISASIVMMGACILRLGRHISRVPQSVVAGFSCGIGGMMIISQLRTIFGVAAPSAGWKEPMLSQLVQIVQQIGTLRVTPTVLALIVVAVATAAVYRMPRSPAPLLGLIMAVLVAKAFGWHDQEVGALPLGMPPFAGFKWEPSDFWRVLPEAFGLAFVTSVNTLITARVVEHFRGRHRHIKKHDADIELGAYGFANLACGTFGAPVSVGIPARSLANVQCGGSTGVANLLHGLFLVGLLGLGSHFIAQIPLAALAAITAWMGARLLDWSTWRRLPKMRHADAAAFVTTAFAVLIVNAIIAVAAGCAWYLVRYLYLRYSRPSLAAGRALPSAAETPLSAGPAVNDDESSVLTPPAKTRR